MVNHYASVGLDESASNDDFVKAYRNLYRQYHPDRNICSIESEQSFKLIQEVYDFLSDSDKKKQ